MNLNQYIVYIFQKTFFAAIELFSNSKNSLIILPSTNERAIVFDLKLYISSKSLCEKFF